MRPFGKNSGKPASNNIRQGRLAPRSGRPIRRTSSSRTFTSFEERLEDVGPFPAPVALLPGGSGESATTLHSALPALLPTRSGTARRACGRRCLAGNH